MESSNLRVGGIDVLDGNTSLDGAQGVPCWLVAHLVPEDGQAAVLVLELRLVLPRHLRLGIQVHADNATVGSANHTKGKILQSVRRGASTCIVTVPQAV